MLRTIYILLLHLHPACFRQRFGAEMLAIFEDARGLLPPVLLIGDGILSLFRQWMFRSEFRRSLDSPTIDHSAGSWPQFRTLDQYTPQGSVVVSGFGLAALTFGMFAGLLAYGVHEQRFLIGARDPGQRLLPVARSSFEAADLHTTVTVAPPAEDPLKAIAAVYFKIIRALEVLDSDKDLVLSPWEVFTAPAALRKLDIDHDGKLSAEELGFSAGANPMPKEIAERARMAFMREQPVLAALDAEHDGEVSAAEIANSFRSLRVLDRNGDGSLTPDELIPDQRQLKAAMLFMRLDADGDGVISSEEGRSQEDASLRVLLQSADRNHDGFVTRRELQEEMLLRAEQRRQLDAARRAGGVR